MTNFYYFIVLHHTTLLNKRLSCLFDTCRGKMLLGDIFNSVFFYSYYADSLSVPIMPLSQETNAMHAKRWWMTPPPFRNEDLELPWKPAEPERHYNSWLWSRDFTKFDDFAVLEYEQRVLWKIMGGKRCDTCIVMTGRQFHCDVPVDSQTLRAIVCHAKNLDRDSHRVIIYSELWLDNHYFVVQYSTIFFFDYYLLALFFTTPIHRWSSSSCMMIAPHNDGFLHVRDGTILTTHPHKQTAGCEDHIANIVVRIASL